MDVFGISIKIQLARDRQFPKVIKDIGYQSLEEQLRGMQNTRSF